MVSPFMKRKIRKATRAKASAAKAAKEADKKAKGIASALVVTSFLIII